LDRAGKRLAVGFSGPALVRAMDAMVDLLYVRVVAFERTMISSSLGSSKGSGISSYPRAVIGEGGVRPVTQRSARFQNLEVFLQLRSGLGRSKRDRDGRVLEDETVPVGRAGDGESGRILRRRAQERPPAERGVGDDRYPKRPRHRKYLSFGATVGRIVADHKHVEVPALRHARR